MHVPFRIHYRNNLIDKKDSYPIPRPPSWDDRNCSYSHQLYSSAWCICVNYSAKIPQLIYFVDLVSVKKIVASCNCCIRKNEISWTYRPVHGDNLPFENNIYIFMIKADFKSSFWFRFLVFNATFNNIWVISWWPVLLVEETGVTWRKPSSFWVKSGSPMVLSIIILLSYEIAMSIVFDQCLPPSISHKSLSPWLVYMKILFFIWFCSIILWAFF